MLANLVLISIEKQHLYMEDTIELGEKELKLLSSSIGINKSAVFRHLELLTNAGLIRIKIATAKEYLEAPPAPGLLSFVKPKKIIF